MNSSSVQRSALLRGVEGCMKWKYRLRAVAFSAIPASAMGIPPTAAERNAAAVKKTPTPGWKNGELKLARDQAATGSSRVTIQAAVRRCAMGELGKSEISVQKTISRI